MQEYSSFPFSIASSIKCQIENDDNAECKILSENKFQIKLSTPMSQVHGVTIGSLFKNPYSTRSIRRLQFVLLAECQNELIRGESNMSQFINARLDKSKIDITSSSLLIADTEATLQVKF